MSEVKKSIFRQQSLERISSPEQLDQFLQVTRPSTWMVLGAIIVLLLGFCVWGVLGHLDTKVDVAVVSEDGIVMCVVPSDIKVNDNSSVEIAGVTYSVSYTGMTSVVDDSFSTAVKMTGDLMDGMFVDYYVVSGTLSEGVYAGVMTVERVSPMSFIFN